jgi:hypothetical protein
MTYGMEDQTDVATDMEGMEEMEDRRDEADGFPCTNAGLACLHQEWTNETEKTGIINSYVLMNTMGNCLVRRNRNLHFTKKQELGLREWWCLVEVEVESLCCIMRAHFTLIFFGIKLIPERLLVLWSVDC